jgi:PAS domain S-box-containing protein
VLDGLRRAAEVEQAHLTRLAPADGVPEVAAPEVAAPVATPEAAPPAGPGAALAAALRRLGRRLPPGEPWVGKVADLEPDLGAPLAAAGIGSLACVPTSVGGEPWALLSISSAEVDREWSPIDVEALEMAARILGAAEENELARAALLASEARYRNVVESASDLIQSIDREGRIRFVNGAWAAALEWSREEAVGLTLWDVVDPAEQARCREVLDRVLAGEGQGNLQTTLRTRGGARLRVEGNAAVQLEGGKPVGTLAIFRNVTERDRLARMKDEFVATVSHELRTPLTSILGALSLLGTPRLEQHPERRRELTEVAVRNGERLLRLVNELLDIQKLEAGQLRMIRSALEVGELLEEAGHGVAAVAEGKGVRLRLASEGGLRALADRERMVQVLINLLGNAIKFSPSGGEVLARARAAGPAVEIEVIDHGPGIPPEFRRRLFEAFAQADGGSTRAAGGSGLGLYISRQLVEAMAGAIRVEDAPGGGTRAVVTLPRAAPAESAAAPV